MQQLKSNILKITKEPRKLLPTLFKNLDVLIYSVAVFLLMLPYVIYKKLTWRKF
jgi:hypothetical protein